MLGSSIDKPLMESPSAGGQLAGGPGFRQPGDLGRYIAFNDPGQPGVGFSNYQDYLAAGNKPVPMNLKTLEGVSNANFNTSPLGTLNVIDPNREARKKADEEFLKTADEYQRGFRESEFYKPNAPTTMDVVNYTYQGKPITGSSSNISQFQKYLDSIGKGDLIQRNDQLFSQETGSLAQIGGGIPRPPGFDLNYERRPNNPSDPILSLNPDFTPSFDLKQADPNNLISGYTPPTGGGTFNGVPLFPFPGMNNTETASASDQRGLPSILGINSMGQQSSFEQTFNDKQGLDGYVDDLVNDRLKDIFGGIMGVINV